MPVQAMELHYRLTEEDLLNSWRGSPKPRFGLFLYILLLALLVLVGMYLIQNNFVWLGGLSVVSSIVIRIAAFEVPRMRARRAFKNSPSIQGEIDVTFTDKGAVWKYPTGESYLNWQGYIKHKETGVAFLLYHSPDRYTFIPKRAMSPEQIEELRGMLKIQIPAH
jgi:YcxB-like protein